MIRKLIICVALLAGICPMIWGAAGDVPNPKTYDAENWVSDPYHILDSETKNKINDILQQLEDSLTIEAAVVALNSIGEEELSEFAVTLFNQWGIGRAEDDNGLLILLTRDIRDITFKTGYGLEGVLPDAICKRIQMETMAPYFRKNDWNTGMLEGVKAVAAVLYGSDYQAAPPEAWIKKFRRTTPSLVFIVFAIMLILINWFVWKSATSRMTPKDDGAEAALTLLATRKPFTVSTLLGLCWLVPVWPAFLGVACWYFGIQKQKTLRRSRICPKCNRETLREIPLHELVNDTERLTDGERKEIELKTAYIRIYRCSARGEEVKIRIPLEKDGYECCPSCRHMTLHREEKYRTVIRATTSSEGLMEACHKCLHCGVEYIVGYTIPKINTSSSRSGRSGGSRGGSFGGGSSGGGGSSSRF